VETVKDVETGLLVTLPWRILFGNG
jgi:hypothetical protein